MDQRPAQAKQPALRIDGDLHVPMLVAFLIAGKEMFAAVLDPFDRPAQHFRRRGDIEVFGIIHAFRPEPAADIGWRDHPDLVFRHAHHPRIGVAHHMRGLGVGPDRHGVGDRVMGGDQATDTLLDITVKAMQRQGDAIDAAELAALRDRVKSDYDRQVNVKYAAAHGWIDAIVDPAMTRETLIDTLEVVTRSATDEPFRTGVYQV